jgi:small conductance mechanosensitive channel
VPDAADQLIAFLDQNWLWLLVGTVLALVAFRSVRPLVRRLAERAIRARQAEGMDPGELDELRKRITTVEDLVAKLLKAALVLVVVIVVFTVFDLFPVVAVFGLLLAGLAVAGQSIVLDYLMGILILLEGQFYVGDWIEIVTNTASVEGTVEEIGLRRTVLRDTSGTVHSVSNGEIRVSSNLTRVFAVIQAEIPLLPETDIDRAIVIANRVGDEMQADPDWTDRLLETPRYASIPMVSDLGVTLRVAGRVRGPDRFAAASELRRRLLVAFAAEGIGLAQRARPPAT